jgi:hypothetical protein
MSHDRLAPGGRRRLDPRSSWGELAFAALLVAVLSGIALALPYDVQKPYDSLAWLLLTNPGAAFFRNVHYWAAQLFLLLTLAHTWDHLARSTETRVPRAVWRRVTLSLPLAAFLMLSGFMLKGDPEAQQALRIVVTMTARLPLVGPLIAAALFGTGSSRQILYVHHIATATIFTWLFVAEHARAVWPRLVSTLEVFVPVAVVGLLVSPALHDGLDPIVKGPWYFLGLQEALHWTSEPLTLVAVGVAALGLLLFLPRLSDRGARLGKIALLVGLAGYAGLTAVGLLFRGENWQLGLVMAGSAGPGRNPSGLVTHGLGYWRSPSMDEIVARGVPVVLGRREGCLFCHRDVKGLSVSHRPDAVGCASCHAGNPFTLNTTAAHDGLVLIPGNLSGAARTCGAVACHPSPVERVPRSLMASMAGVIAVDRSVWGDRRAGAAPADVRALGRTGADSHLRQLCASCHLGAGKSSLGPVGENSRGGGCTACHLTYSSAALDALSRYQRDRARTVAPLPPPVHPDVSIAISQDHCFGCHSRSGRISTNYEGWHETPLSTPPAGDGRRYRTLEDGRVFVFVAPDIHAAQGMACIDCHGSRDVMGDGLVHGRESEAVRVACEDCHLTGQRAGLPSASGPAAGGGHGGETITFEQLDAESRKIAILRGRSEPGDRFLATADGRQPLLNTSFEADQPLLVTKNGRARLPLKPPAAVCREGGGHERLSCISCHGAWAPRCPSCHTGFEPGREAVDQLDGTTSRGAWVETAGEFVVDPPTLGVRAARAAGTPGGIVDPFVPGMILTIDRNQSAGGRPDTVFRRLYARTFSHTVAKGSRSCRSCHADPIVLGYGAGELRYERVGGNGRWRFTPRYRPGPDGLPADAWIAFLQERTAGASTRPDVRPFSIEEQRRILTVGACLTCHEPTSPALRSAVQDFRATLARVSPKCLLPAW